MNSDQHHSDATPPVDLDPTLLIDATIRIMAPGQVLFDRFELKKVLGGGGMGIVWLAADRKLEMDVALKFLPQLILTDSCLIDDLKRETRRTLALTHPNVVRTYDFIQDGRAACISMEYVDGPTLASLRLAQPQKVFEPETLRPWMTQWCEAMAYAHEHARIAHRDLKPRNLMINSKSMLKVADFGIARSLADSKTAMTLGAGISGTLSYMSPQQMSGETATPLDDIYSMGATLYDLLTGKPPFHSGDIPWQVREKIPPSIAERRAEFGIDSAPVPAEWERATQACLSKDPTGRPQNAGQLLEILGLSEPRRPVPGPHRPAYVAKDETTQKRPRGVVGAAMAGTVVLLAAGIIWTSTRPHGPPAAVSAGGVPQALSNANHFEASPIPSVSTPQPSTPTPAPVSPVPGMVRQALQMLDENRYSDALPLLTQALEADANSAEAHVAMSRVSLALNDAKRARDEAERAVELKPSDPDGYVAKAAAERALVLLPEAKEDAAKAVQAGPDSAAAHAALSFAESALKDYPDAKEESDRALETDSNYAEGYVARVLALRGLRQFEFETAEADKAVRANPLLPGAYLARSAADSDIHDYEMERADCDHAISLDPENVMAYANRADADLHLNDPNQAKEDADKAISLDPGYSLSYVNRATSYRLLQMTDRAVSDCNAAIEINPNLANAYSERALDYLSLQDNQKAMDDANKVLVLEPSNYTAHCILAAVAANQGDYSTVLDECNKALALDATIAAAYELRSRAYHSLGDETHSQQDADTAKDIAAKSTR